MTFKKSGTSCCDNVETLSNRWKPIANMLVRPYSGINQNITGKWVKVRGDNKDTEPETDNYLNSERMPHQMTNRWQSIANMAVKLYQDTRDTVE